ncbi:MAG: phage tail protein [Myxococcales bacterium]|nr:phage tail protein [Myxococcales bacterium]
MFAGNFAPRGWALCDGQLLSIAQNQALFSILGTTYGGDGINTFALPDLRGRAPVGWGHGPGLSDYRLGEATGSETVTLTVNQIPSHGHTLQATGETPDGSSDPRNKTLAGADIYHGAAGEGAMSQSSITNTGGSQSHDNIQPVLALSFIIALQGLFPSRN